MVSSDLTMVDAFKKGLQMSLIKKENKEGLQLAVILLITKLVNSQHTSQKMSSESIADCAIDIVKDFWYMKFEEIVLIFDSIRKNKSFNRLDQSVIYDGFAIYEKNERDSILERARNEQKVINQEQIDEEVRLIREKYTEVATGKGFFIVTQINNQEKIEKQKTSIDNNDYIKIKAEWLKNRKK